MPKSHVRRKAVYTPPPQPQKVRVSPGWLAPAMVVLWVIGIAWIAVYYVTAGDLPVMRFLGDWSLVVGFGVIIVGFGMATKWR